MLKINKGEIFMAEAVIELNGLTKQYMKNEVVKDASFTISRGMICGLVGPNGAGKTTIMKILGGLVFPTKGNIVLFGKTSEKELAHERSRMCFMIETPFLKENMTARENLEKIRIQKGYPDKNRINEVLELTGLGDTGRKTVKKFSLGMKQRLGIAAALLSKPEVLILDEPVNGLDPEGIVEIRKLLQKLNLEENITILISSHILPELSMLCTDYVFIRKGKVVSKLSSEELKRECNEYYHIKTSDDAMVPDILRNQLGIDDFEVANDGSVRIFERLNEVQLISETLFKNGIIPIELHINEASLEQFYMRMVGE